MHNKTWKEKEVFTLGLQDGAAGIYTQIWWPGFNTKSHKLVEEPTLSYDIHTPSQHVGTHHTHTYKVAKKTKNEGERQK